MRWIDYTYSKDENEGSFKSLNPKLGNELSATSFFSASSCLGNLGNAKDVSGSYNTKLEPIGKCLNKEGNICKDVYIDSIRTEAAMVGIETARGMGGKHYNPHNMVLTAS
ncbi:hypothetical protein OIU85_028060 [Salix viminalis]|uniref:Uncharacterized protein n=1 Tax=Salix viminalis TaxID=40686 RepID=A0A9Q0QJX9_SALVM|nr:hypothetical protein OIU85_028060 [Salix viminalis]